ISPWPAAAAFTWSRSTSTMPSAGISTSAYSSPSSSGKYLSPPSRLWSTTSPVTTRSDNMTPTIFAIAFRLRKLLLEFRQPVQPIERRNLIALGQRRIVEHRIHEVIQRSAQCHHRLPNVQQLARAL